MKYIKNNTEDTVVIRDITIGKGQRLPIANEEILNWEEIKELKDNKEIEVIEGEFI
jgi:hypothetical protein